MTSFDDLTDMLFAGCDEVLGDTITVTVPGNAPAQIKAHVDNSDGLYQAGLSSATMQDMELDFAKSHFTNKPADDWIVQIASRAGQSFKPRDVRTDVSGRRWKMGLKEIPA